MEPGSPDVLEQLPAGGGVSTPASGTYGEKAANQRLESALPDTAHASPQDVSGAPMPTNPLAPPAPGGLSQAILAPTAHPQTPVSTPLTGPAPSMPGQNEASVVDALRRLVKDPQRTEATKEWAQMLIDAIDSAGQ